MSYHHYEIPSLITNMHQEQNIKAYRRDRKRKNHRKMRIVGNSIRLLVNIIKKRASNTTSLPKKKSLAS